MGSSHFQAGCAVLYHEASSGSVGASWKVNNPGPCWKYARSCQVAAVQGVSAHHLFGTLTLLGLMINAAQAGLRQAEPMHKRPQAAKQHKSWGCCDVTYGTGDSLTFRHRAVSTLTGAGVSWP